MRRRVQQWHTVLKVCHNLQINGEGYRETVAIREEIEIYETVQEPGIIV